MAHTSAGEVAQLVVSVGPPTTYLKEGLAEREVLRLLGSPALTTLDADGSGVKTCEFWRGGGRVVVAEFKGGVLLRTRTVVRAEATEEAGVTSPAPSR